MAEKTRAYLLWECNQGWCIKRVNEPDIIGNWNSVLAFSRLTQALWWLGRQVNKPAASDPDTGSQ